MHGSAFGNSAVQAIPASAESCRQRQNPAEPLLFAVICRYLWGPNAPKELKFVLDESDGGDRSERTCRAWTSGDSIPQSDVLFTLLLSKHGRAILDYLMANSGEAWWLDLMRAERIVTAEDQIDRS